MLNKATRRTSASKHSQRGAVTLIITLIIVLAIALLTFTMTTTTTLENRMTASDQRSKEAFQAAQAGLDFALDQFMLPDGTGMPELNRCVLRTVSGSEANGQAEPTFELLFGGQCPNVAMGLMTAMAVRSVGRSADGSAVRVLEAQAQFLPVWLNEPPEEAATNPAVVRAMTSMQRILLDGTAESGECNRRGENRTGTFYTGNGDGTEELELGQCSTYDDPGKPKAGTSPGVEYAEAGSAIEPQQGVPKLRWRDDNYAADSTNTPSTSAEFFEYIFGEGTRMDSYESEAAYYPKADGSLPREQTVYYDGDLTLAGGDVLGSEDKPITLVVDGNLDLSGNSVIWGVVYVVGSTGVGNSKIIGTLASESDINLTGTSAVIYNEAVATPTLPNETGEVLSTLDDVEVFYSSDTWRGLPAD